MTDAPAVTGQGVVRACSPPVQHEVTERCYFCASDGEMLRALAGRSPVTVWMQKPESFCPVAVPAGPERAE